MSATITTTTTTTTYTTTDSFYGGSFKPRGGEGGPDLHDISHGSHIPEGSKESLADAIDDMAVPSWVKAMAKNILGVDDDSRLPSESGAAKTINNFQKEHDIGLLSVEQMQKMAETGYCTGKDGKTFQVPEEVQLAAQRMMANNGELFKKLEAATDGRHDGQLGQGDYGNAIKDGTISRNGGDETRGSSERGLSPGDFLNAIMNGNIASTRPSEYGAAKTINDFQKEHDIGLLSVDNLKMMAETGYCKDKDGNLMQVPEEVQGAAQRMMENNGELFKKLEAATDGKHDGQLGQGDFGAALQDGAIGKDNGKETVTFGGPDSTQWGGQADGLPSDSSAAKTINDFQKDKDIGLLSIENLKMMAETGYCKDKNGNTVQVPEEVQLAAQKMLDNNGELFKKLESATDGKHDGKLGQGDYDKAIEDGTISKNTGPRSAPAPDAPIDDLPTSAAAAKTINEFQKDKDIGLLSVENLKMMAETGYCKDKNGNTVQVPEEVQLAAQKMLENNGELFKKLEAATNGKHDGLLGQGDYNEAIDDGTISA
ncbi:hypothetical protein [Pseudoduganella chitinolytica]|uniref:Uncharacterized protein n=1 Tax=Pseudoduganella chitinolytica TaxID=34070 RepID=A0ABY8B9V1_9BURK|nr:hypothetical protein [Pseudoduganella chitinolytica]WEF32213.1 hypothetical protein PX653_22775 [Pseudoduganella chitinolytica]